MEHVSFTYNIPPKSIGGFEIDAFLVEEYSFENSISDLPAEEEADTKVDTIKEEPDTITIKAFIGQTKFEAFTGDVASMPVTDGKARIIQAYNELLRMKRSLQPVDLVTGLGVFPNMAIMSLNISREAATGADLPFSMTFKNAAMIERDLREKREREKKKKKKEDSQAGAPGQMGHTGSTSTDPSNWIKEEWQKAVQSGTANEKDYQRKWGVPYPQ